MDAHRRIKFLPRLKKGSFQRIVSNNKPTVPGKMAKIRIVRPSTTVVGKVMTADGPKPTSLLSSGELKAAEEARPEVNPITDEEKRLADYMETKQEETAKVEAPVAEVIEPVEDPMAKVIEIETAEGKTAELPFGDERLVGEVPQKRRCRRGRKGKRQ